MSDSRCELCHSDGGELVVRTPRWRIILANEPAYPGFCRVVWHDHVREMTDLTSADRDELMRVVWAVETVVREVMAPDKINLATLGNVVPHLHWHVIPRYEDDPTFPAPVWAPPQRTPSPESLASRQARVVALWIALVKQLQPS